MDTPVRVRFAPSPTGPLHIGGLRTALFNYLFARKHGGTFILRIEDTDQSRFVPGATEYIIDALDWLGIPYDEGPGKDAGFGPYLQSERKAIYESYAVKLIDAGWAYFAWDLPETLEGHRKDHETKGKTFIYNWHNREKLDNSLVLDPVTVRRRLETDEPYVIRFKWQKDAVLELVDAVRGKIQVDSNTLDDKILFKSDGMPTYHLANIVDDHLMEISHVIRGEEWLPSLPLHSQLYRAFGWEAPKFAHLPLIMKPTGKGKLSKRDGDKMGFPVFPLTWENSPGYREAGFFPEAVMNFLALLGWNPGTEQEIFSREELVKAFSLDRVHKAGARFDPEKNKWYNHQHLQQKALNELVGPLRLVLADRYPPAAAMPDEFLARVISLLRERANFLTDIWDQGRYFFVAPDSYDDKAIRKHWKTETPGHLSALLPELEQFPEFSAAVTEAAVKSWIAETGRSFGQVMPPLRLALVGALQGPHLFDIMELIGRSECLGRISRALEVLPGQDEIM